MNPQNEHTPSAPAGETGMGGGTTEKSGPLADTKNKLTQTAREAAAKVKSAASTTAAKAKDEASRVVSEKKETAANRLGSYSSAIHDSAQSLEEKDPNIAWFTHRAADRLQGVADYLRERDFNGLRGDCENVARRHPAAFFGGMFLAGLLVGNFVKATARGSARGDPRRDDGDRENGPLDYTPENDVSTAERSAAGI